MAAAPPTRLAQYRFGGPLNRAISPIDQEVTWNQTRGAFGEFTNHESSKDEWSSLDRFFKVGFQRKPSTVFEDEEDVGECIGSEEAALQAARKAAETSIPRGKAGKLDWLIWPQWHFRPTRL